jgi:TRAP-type C4-dicarboxylate transport system permease small subunit
MIEKILVSVGVIFYALVVPFFEISDTHVFNPEWGAHAKLHEVWQLATNCLIGIFSIWLIWVKKEILSASILTMFITLGFMIAYYSRESYGGSMVLSNGTEKLVAGINIGVLGFGIAIIFAITAVFIDMKNKSNVESS